MTQLRIDEVTPSKSGKAWRVQAGGKWYGASKDTHADSLKGQVCEVEIKTTDFGPWMETILPLKSAPSAPTQATGPSYDKRVTPTPLPSGVAPYWMPFASNVVAHAIAAGIVKEPSDIKAWVLAAKEAAQKATGGDIDF